MNIRESHGTFTAENSTAQSALNDFFNRSLDLFCLSGENGYFQHLNPAWEKVLGWTREELMSRPWIEFVYPDDVEASLEAHSKCLSKDIFQFENRYCHKNGSYRVLSWSISYHPNKLFYAVGRDITEYKRVTEALEQQVAVVQSLQDTLDRIGDGIAVVDKSGKAIYLNQAGLKIHRKNNPGQAFEDWTQEFELYKMDKKTRLSAEESPAIRALKGDLITQVEVYLNYHDTREGIYLNVSASPIVKKGQITGAVVIFRNIERRIQMEEALQKFNQELEQKTKNRTAELRNTNKRLQKEISYRKQAQRALIKSEARFRNVVNSNLMGIIFWNINGTIKDVNDTFLNMMGYTREDLKSGKISWQRITPSEFDNRDERGWTEIAVTEACTPLEKEYIRKDNSRIPILLGGTLLPGIRDMGVSFVIDISDRKQAEAALRDSEQRYRLLFESHPLPMWVYDVETLAFLAVNDAAIYHYGYSREEFLSMTIADIRPPEDIAALKAMVSRCRETTYSHSGIWKHCKKDGTTIDVEITSNAIVFDGRKARVILANDISDRLRSQEALLLSEKRFRLAVDNIPDVFVIYDDRRRFQFVNVEGIRRSGFSEEALIGHTDEEIFPPEVTDSYLPTLQQAVETRSLQTVECTINLPTVGTYTFVATYLPLLDERGEIYQILGITHDISDLKRGEAEIRQLNQTLEEQVMKRTAELETLFNTLPDYIFVIEREGMIVSFCNDVFARNIGLLNRKNVQGKSIFECFPVPDAQCFAAQNNLVFESKKTFHEEETIVLPDGVHHFDTFKVPLKNKQGEVYGLLGTARDITELIETKKSLFKRTNELEVVNQELDSFAYSVSHDLQAPLRHIRGFANVLKDRLISNGAIADPNINHYLEIIETSSNKMALLIEGLLTLSRLGRQALVTRPVALQPLVTTAINLIVSQNPEIENRWLEFQVEALPTVMGDATLLQQVFTNLIDNAVKFTQTRSPAKIAIGTLPNGTIFIKDNGVGFQMKYADKLFGAFQRIHSPKLFEGTGIGLAIVQRIIHRHGGKIWAESEPDKGTTFYFNLVLESEG